VSVWMARRVLNVLYWLCEHTGHPFGCWLLNCRLGNRVLTITIAADHPQFARLT
jgi:hypothetical protein